WRERRGVAVCLAELVSFVGDGAVESVCSLVRKALEDEVAVVREAGVFVVPPVFQALARYSEARDQLNADICALAWSPFFRRRMTFVACYQRLVTSSGSDVQAILSDDRYWECFTALAGDAIVDVRIGVARLVGILCGRFSRGSASMPPRLEALVGRLRGDASREVRSYVPAPSSEVVVSPPAPVRVLVGNEGEEWDANSFATFSRPPPPGLAVEEEEGGAEGLGVEMRMEVDAEVEVAMEVS
ncbi:hypothetical protein EW146_g957, partial [Bondarzewia mesenterica]